MDGDHRGGRPDPGSVPPSDLEIAVNVPVRTRHPRRVGALGLGAVLSVLVAAPAAAHVTADPSATDAGGRAIIDFRVPHGCDGQATEVLEVAIPAGVLNVRPEQVAGWDATTEIGEYDEPATVHGEEVTEGVVTVAWTARSGNELTADQFRDFGIAVTYPDDEGAELVFPAIQTCVDGAEEAWIERSDDPDADLDHPAPRVTLTAPAHLRGADGRAARARGRRDGAARRAPLTTRHRSPPAPWLDGRRRASSARPQGAGGVVGTRRRGRATTCTHP